MDTIQALQIIADHPEFRLLRRVPEQLQSPPAGEGDTGLALIIDTETTGMDKQYDVIIEVGMLLVRYRRATGEWLEIVGQYDGLEDPGQPLSQVVQTVTGLSDADLAGQRMDDACVNDLARQADLVIAHNAAFDRPFLSRRWPIFQEKSFACSVNEIDWMAAGFTSAKLELLVYHCGYFYDSHRALNDCWALLFVLGQVLAPRGETALSALLQSADKPSFLLNLQVRFDDKDKLKAIGGFQWLDGSDARHLPKSWLRRCKDKVELRAVLDSIHAQVFGGRSFPCQIGKLTALERYATNPQTLRMKSYEFPAPGA
ncbi:3'-5' exonuclease [Paludibacterium purpuratum]|uniref:DNA polymerase-3 subunit epsilon n=1 Tax=Paludibacterium purpuratum TaxID=1144873 RepID=A0A4V3DVL3_9NEIS|nr:3'-5' exonuclease [Paludibacterium purpuratum]TDR81469.1 DNA polymerase-3 subunit epsilon [Paludibacterium purpuratum]